MHGPGGGRRGRKAGTPVVVLGAVLALVAALIGSSFGLAVAAPARQAQTDYSPATGHAQVIAQGVVGLPAGEVVWRTIRARAPLPADALFEERQLGFVLAETGALLLVDGTTGAQVRLGPGEAALVPPGTIQRRASLGDRPVSYLAIELAPADAPPPADGATVLQPGQPFAAPTGLRDLDLVRDVLVGTETVTVPDSGAKNVILATDGTLAVGRPGGQQATLLAGEAATFSGELAVSVAAEGGEPAPDAQATFVVAMIGPEVAPAVLPEPAATAATAATAGPSPAAPTAVGPTTPEGAGSISVQVYTCPPGMTAETLAVAVCAAAAGDYDVTLSGGPLDSPLTIADASVEDGAATWSGLPFGDYLIAEAVPPVGYETYVLAAPGARGDPDTGYTVTLDAEHPRLVLRIYNFAPA